MKNKFKGFSPPSSNYSKLPHEFIEALPDFETAAELKVVLYVIRHTWGFNDEIKKITIDEFANGRKKKDGTRLDRGVGMTKSSVIDGLNRAIEHGFIVVLVDDRDMGRVKKYYTVNIIQGSNNYTPGVQSLYPSSKEVIPRTEKETPGYTLKDRQAPPDFSEIDTSGSPSRTQSPDYLDLAVEASLHGTDETLFSHMPKDQFWSNRDAFLKVYQERRGNPGMMRDQIVELGHENNADPKVWDEAILMAHSKYRGRGQPDFDRCVNVYRILLRGGKYEDLWAKDDDDDTSASGGAWVDAGGGVNV